MESKIKTKIMSYEDMKNAEVGTVMRYGCMECESIEFALSMELGRIAVMFQGAKKKAGIRTA